LRDISPHIAYGIGIDRRVEAKKEGNIETVKAYFEEHLQISNESIDVVTMMAVLEHVEDQHALLKECLRVLRPGGKILVTVPNYINKFIGEFLAFRLKIISEEAYRDHKRYYSKKELKQDLEQAGFIIRILKNWELGTNVFAEAYKEK
jgi:ubiquinone/menaquinone biosynthesis C-methylase UbiE